ncbi:MAG: glycoside hydrolase family 3 C-terminal domain-containing protein, partial [Microthrixaceae bacterium]|nr:glycoside hydrolase family 3 C-terminal domain-containing protein [Microthrixaceae bacterium]
MSPHRASDFDQAPAGAADAAFGSLAGRQPSDGADLDREVSDLLDRMSVDERGSLLSGDDPLLTGLVEMARWYNRRPIVAGALARLGLPGIRFSDGPRGVVMYRSTAFPSSMARAATFDPGLEERVGDAIGVEARAQGANLFAGVCINLLRHPAWGRSQETYGEDSYLVGEMGAALTRGVQRHVMACVKHYAANSMENSRFWVDVRIADRDLHDLYLPHFKRVVDEGVASVMTAYNRVNGNFCGHHRYLITDVLKGRWSFDGFVMSDFTFGIRGPSAVNAGMDLEMPQGAWFRRLPARLRRGAVSQERIDDAVNRLVRAQLRFASRGEPDRYRPDAVASPEHRELAAEAAARSLVLLRNEPPRPGCEPVLPIDLAQTTSVAVIGPLAAIENLGDRGSSKVTPPEVVTVLDGLREAAGRHGIAVHHDDGADLDAAARLAARCDSAVTVVGATWRDEGEWVGSYGGDRRSLRLPTHHEELIRAVGGANASQAVVLMGGSAFATDQVERCAPAIIMAWYPGMEGGRAIAEVLLGDREPEGRLPLTWPNTTTELPRFRRFARRITYGPLHGYRMMEATGQEPGHWFGHGLGYTTFDWARPEITAVEDRGDGTRMASVAVEVHNTGSRPGTEVVQVYVPEVLGTYRKPLNTLRG